MPENSELVRSWKLTWNRGDLGKNGKMNNKDAKRPTPSYSCLADETAIRRKGLNIVDYDLFSVEVK
jgi:hypothetical protein